MSKFEVVIGIEIHIALNTKTKMFSSAKNEFNDKPNTNVWPVDLGYPGALPIVNKEAVVKAIKFGKALKMNLRDTLYFDRKNYYYPDLPKGYQITQNDKPIGEKGILNLLNKKINIERIQLEEDTAKSIHKNNKTFLNYNRSGVPLIEVVSKPEIKNGEEASEYVQKIKDLVISLNISDGKMENGSLRADINISLKPFGQKKLGTKVEIKNLNSIANIKKAVDIEIKKQTKSLLNKEEIIQSTKRFDEASQDTIIMRIKKSQIDYKFFPEPNIPPIYIGKEFIDSIEINELPWEKKERYLKDNIPLEFIEQLISNKEQSDYFDSINYVDRSKVVKLFFSEIVSLSNLRKCSIKKLNIKPIEIDKILQKIQKNEISGKHAKEIISLLNKNNDVEKIIKEKNMKLISNEYEIQKLLNEILELNKEFINKNKKREERIIKFLLGQLMKKTQGQINPILANKLIKIKLKK